MTVSTIATIAAGLSRATPNSNTSRASAVLGSLFENARKPGIADSAKLPAAVNLQNQAAQLRVAAQDVAQASALVSTAQTAVTQIAQQLERLSAFAKRAAESESGDREALNDEFQATRQKIDRLARETRFNNEPLLDGKASSFTLPTGQGELALGSFTDAALLQEENVEILTPSGARIALATVEKAQAYVTEQLSTLSRLQEGADFAASALEVALQNQEASRATIDVSELEAAFTNQPATVTIADQVSLAAQINRLPEGILKLAAE